MAENTFYEIAIDGEDVSSNFAPLLHSLTIRQSDDSTTDSCAIELDDSYGQIELPLPGAQVSVSLGSDQSDGVVAFEGYLDEPKSGGHGHKHADFNKNHHLGGGSEQGVHADGGRQKGRVLTITAKSADMTSNVKQQQHAHLDNSSFGDAAQQFASNAGLSAVVDQSLSSIQRNYWSIANESFIDWGRRIASEIGATFKVLQGQAVFAARAGGMSATGQEMESINAVWGQNLLEWSIAPVLARPDFGTTACNYYDPQAAQWQTATQSNSGSQSQVTHTHHFKAPDQDQAQSRASSNATESSRNKGGGEMVTIDGEPNAQPGAMCNVDGIRDGVDGTYLITGVTHMLVRGGGYTTQLTLKQPSDGAGTDSRSSSSSGGDSGGSGGGDSGDSGAGGGGSAGAPIDNGPGGGAGFGNSGAGGGQGVGG